MEHSQIFDARLAETTQDVERVLARYLPAEDEHSRLTEAMRYSCMAGGKRIRPILLLESVRLFGGPMDAAEPFAAAIEMIHTHSLIHDDLPALDDDALRRGMATTHVVYGEAMAILAGDALLNRAYETAVCAFDRMRGTREETDRVIRSLALLSDRAGASGMLGGQSADVENDKRARARDAAQEKPDEEMLEYICLRKTAALIEAPLMIGAILSGADEADIRRMEEIGRGIGVAFQICDDILDVTSTEEVLGKPIHSDEKHEKVTFAALYGIETAREAVRVRTEHALALLGEIDGDAAFLAWILQKLAGREM